MNQQQPVPFLSHTCLSTLTPPARQKQGPPWSQARCPAPAHGGHLTHTLDERTNERMNE